MRSARIGRPALAQTSCMDEKRKRLLAEMEALRGRLHELAQEHRLGSPEILDLSRKLDKLIHEYNRLGNAGDK